jgi:hypothetical protein
VKLLYTKCAWFCKACGSLAYRATVPADRNVKDYAPAGECGRCGSIEGFTQREDGR